MHSEEAGQRSAALRVLGTLARHDFDAVKAGVMEVMTAKQPVLSASATLIFARAPTLNLLLPGGAWPRMQMQSVN